MNYVAQTLVAGVLRNGFGDSIQQAIDDLRMPVGVHRVQVFSEDQDGKVTWVLTSSMEIV